MKSWFAKFMRAQDEMDRALQRKPTLPQPEGDLHDSIMRAVRQAARVERDERKPARLWPAAVFITASLAAVSFGLWLRPIAPAPQSVVASGELAAAPGAALDLGAQMPGMVLQPLSNELARVDHDIHHTTQVLLASFP